MSKKIFFIETYGCQMNLADSTRLRKILFDKGYEEDTSFTDNTDFVIINTCSVRHSAENRIYGRLGHYKREKEKRSFSLLVMGCMAEKEKSNLLKNAPFIDYVVGTHHLDLIGDLFENSSFDKVHTGFETYNFTDTSPDTQFPFRAFVNIIHGCSNFCSYCIVPYVRGAEISRPSEEIIDEVKRLVDNGVKEIILLGQNVNSYGNDSNYISFSQLLRKIDKVPNLKRLKFISSHPKDFTFELIDTLGELETLCPDIHLPLQSGSNNVLNLMNRKYTIEAYNEKIDRLRARLNNPRLTTDLLVGFPGETEKDYEDTIAAVKRNRFDSAFMYKYSPRKGTKAFDIKEELNPDEKQQRLSKLIEIQNAITIENCVDQVGTIDNVLIESISRNNENEYRGILSRGWCVVFEPNGNKIGDIVNVKVTGISGHTLKGEIA